MKTKRGQTPAGSATEGNKGDPVFVSGDRDRAWKGADAISYQLRQEQPGVVVNMATCDGGLVVIAQKT